MYQQNCKAKGRTDGNTAKHTLYRATSRYSPFKLLYDRINNGQRRGHEVILKITE